MRFKRSYKRSRKSSHRIRRYGIDRGGVRL